MTDFRTKFTTWYVRKGYRMTCKPSFTTVIEMDFQCPWWVRLLTSWFFSPCVYYQEIRNSQLNEIEFDI